MKWERILLVLVAAAAVLPFLAPPMVAGDLEEALLMDVDSLLAMDLEALFNMEVVTATRQAQKISNAPANIIVVTGEMIRNRGYRTLTEVLMDVPGFDFPIGQPSGEYPTHFLLRGISDVGQSKVLVMVDGIVRNDISNGWSRHLGFDFSLHDVKRIEIISGPGSALYGANAYAGLINVITRKGEELFGENEQRNVYFDAKAEFGDYRTVAPEFLAACRFENGLTMQLAGRWYYTEGDGGVDRYDPGNYFHNNFEPDSVLTTEHGMIANERGPNGVPKPLPDGFKTDVNDIFLRGRLMKDGFTLGFSFWDKREGLGSEVPGYEYFANTEDIDYLVHHAGNTIFAEYETALGEKINAMSRLYHRTTRILPETGFVYTYKYQSVDNGVDPPVQDKKKGYHGEGFITGFEEQIDIALHRSNQLVTGFRLERQQKQYFGISLGPEQDASSTIVDYAYDSEQRSVQPMFFSHNAAVFLQDEHRFTDRYILTAGLRFDSDTEYGNILNPRLAFVTNPVDRLIVKFLYGQAYKAPTVFELYDEWRGNKDLEPQKIATSEVEASYRLTEKMSFKAGYFYSDLTDLITVAPNPDTIARPVGPNGELATYYQNIGSTNFSGLTAGTDFFITRDLNLSANYAFTMAEDGEEPCNIAQHKLNAIVNYDLLNRVNINLRGNYIGKILAPESNRYFHPKTVADTIAVGYDYVTEENPDGYLDPVFLLHLAVTWKNLFGPGLKLEPQLIVRNLLGTDHLGMGRQDGAGVRPVDGRQPAINNPDGYIPAYHPWPGREIFFSLQYRF